jgi:2-phosphosulfolactate phosphatase
MTCSQSEFNVRNRLAGTLSPEAHAAATSYRGVQSDLAGLLQACGSGKELLVPGFAKGVALAAALNVSTCVPVFRDGAYMQRGHPGLRNLA